MTPLEALLSIYRSSYRSHLDTMLPLCPVEVNGEYFVLINRSSSCKQYFRTELPVAYLIKAKLLVETSLIFLLQSL